LENNLKYNKRALEALFYALSKNQHKKDELRYNENGDVMLQLAFQKQKEKKFIFSFIGFSLVFMFIYFMLDYLSGGYQPMIDDYGVYLVVINVVLNIVMSLISALMFNLSTAYQDLTKKKSDATSYMPFISVILGFFTYGCTSCMISFLAVVGISFGVLMLPLHNLPYKLIGLLLLLIVFFIQTLIIKKGKCKI